MELLLPAIIGAVVAILVSRILGRVWPKAGKWGVNPQSLSCPHCKLPPPRFRKPANRRQMLWGGWTCALCGREYDKYGKMVSDETSKDG